MYCECFDPQCPHTTHGHIGETRVLYRIDMEDETGIEMCDTCAEDAWSSGLFTDSKE